MARVRSRQCGTELRARLAVAMATACLVWPRGGAAQVAPITVSDGTSNGHAVKVIAWTDSAGAPRAIHVLTDNQRITRVSYRVDGQDTADNETTEGYGIGNLVDHGGCADPSSSYKIGVLNYQGAASFAGPHHLIWHSEFSYRMCDNLDKNWRVTNEYLIATGQDDFLQTIAMDASDLPEGMPPGEDSRSPYGELDFARGPITGMGWGTQYKFLTTSPLPATGDASVKDGIVVSWDWTTPNTVPYVLSWADPDHGGNVDREYGVVQNQLYAEQDMGGGYYSGGDAFAGPPPISGSALPAVWALPTQMGGYDSNYQSGRVTWGATYGTFKNGHSNDTGTIPNMGDDFYPVNAWSWTHVIGKFSDGVVAKRVEDIEDIYRTTMVASVGSVVTRGPRGPGNFVGPVVGSMPIIDYPIPGYNFVYRSWEITAERGVAAFTLTVAAGASLRRPTLIVHDALDADIVLRVNGAEWQPGRDYYASYDAAASRLFITLAGILPAQSNAIVVSPSSANSGDAGAGGTSDGAPDAGAPNAGAPNAGAPGPEAGGARAAGAGRASTDDGGASLGGHGGAPVIGSGTGGSSPVANGGAGSATHQTTGCSCRLERPVSRTNSAANTLFALWSLSLVVRARRKLRRRVNGTDARIR